MQRQVLPCLALALLQTVFSPPRLLAQTTEPTRSNPRLFTHRDAVAATLATGGTLVLAIFDRRIAESISDPSGAVQRNGFLRARSNDFNHISEQPLTLAALGLYGIGRVAHAPTLSDISFHAAEAVVVATLASQAIRIPLGRGRPVVTDGSDPFVFRPFKGVSSRDYRSFPSVHTASTFAAAAVISGETARRWPGARWYVSPVVYTLAAMPGLSRMYLNEHWASDVLAGTFMGVFVGQKVMRYNHRTNPRNRANRFFLGREAGVASRDERTILGFSHTF